MEVYEQKGINKQDSAAKHTVTPMSFTDNRVSAIAQRKLISQMSVKGLNNNVIQRVKDQTLIAFWNGLPGDIKQKFLDDYMMGAEKMSQYLQGSSGYLDGALQKLRTEQANTKSFLTDEHNVYLFDSFLSVPSMAMISKNVGNGFSVEITIPPVILNYIGDGDQLMEDTLPAGTQVGFIQVVKSNKVTKKAKERADKYATEHNIETGWTIDRQTDEDIDLINPYYGMTNTDAVTSNIILGSETNNAIMRDCPTYGSNSEFSWKPDFETSAIIKACPKQPELVGSVLATVKWGFEVKRDKAILPGDQENLQCGGFYVEQLLAPSQEFKNAALIWNQMYTNNSEAKQIPELK